MDFAQKYIKSMVPSQERNLIRLFEKLKLPPKFVFDESELNQSKFLDTMMVPMRC